MRIATRVIWGVLILICLMALAYWGCLQYANNERTARMRAEEQFLAANDERLADCIIQKASDKAWDLLVEDRFSPFKVHASSKYELSTIGNCGKPTDTIHSIECWRDTDQALTYTRTLQSSPAFTVIQEIALQCPGLAPTTEYDPYPRGLYLTKLDEHPRYSAKLSAARVEVSRITAHIEEQNHRMILKQKKSAR